MKQFIKDLWTVLVERQKTRRALRLLSKQEWSIEFLTALLVRSANVLHKPLQLTITQGDRSFTIKTVDIVEEGIYRDDNIFNHLDDESKVRSFINEVNRR